MSDVQIKMTDAQTVAYIDMTGPYDQIPVALGQLYGWVTQHGLQPAGMPAAVYFTPPSADMSQAKWQVRAPLAGDPSACAVDESGCGIERLEPVKVAFAMHKGPYETVAETYNVIAAWIATNGMTIAGPPEESYFSDPATTAPEDYLTEVRMPVI